MSVMIGGFGATSGDSGQIDAILDQISELQSTVSSLTEELNDTSNEVDDLRLQMATIENIYPVGSIYMSYNSTSPETLFGGTWTQLTNRFLIGAGSSYSRGETGGSATVSLTEDEMPSHSHQPNFSTSILGTTGEVVRRNAQSGSGVANVITSQNAFQYVTVYATTRAGGGQAHENMPPYMAVYMWRRTG